KTYGDITFPAGNYEALNVTIGSGKGENWWCVLFPPLCVLDEGSKPLSAESVAAADEINPEANEEYRLQLKWKLIDLLND
ncbi:MAG: stage II sporulation protein R, partial [Ruminococcaceae bacterium]|nr:stage II sporulation protein R [Oscillospiraceae bacterium]